MAGGTLNHALCLPLSSIIELREQRGVAGQLGSMAFKINPLNQSLSDGTGLDRLMKQKHASLPFH